MKGIIFNLVCLATLANSAGQMSGQQVYDLKFDHEKYVTQTLAVEGKTIIVRAYENIFYVARPADTVYQKLNVYIPEEYFTGEIINGYNSQTAPIFFPNQVGGYMPALPASAATSPGREMPQGGGGMMGGPRQSAVLLALSKGYVVASAGARGRTTRNTDDIYTGKAPAGIVDLKAAVRYLKYNDQIMPGDAGRIISNGTSAGGAMSTLLGATGNHPDYEPYLEELGAAEADDNIFAVSAYCPITNLDNADMAYEWQFNGINTYKKRGAMQGNAQEASVLSDAQVIASKELKDLFPGYINGLNLRDRNGGLLTLDQNGNGTFKEFVKSYVIASAQKALDGGTDMSKYSFLTVDNGMVSQIDFGAYVEYLERQKTPPAFDAFDLSSPENQLFGNESVDKQHFTQYALENSKENGLMADKQRVKMMNPLYYIGKPESKTAEYWRVRHGTKDKDTGLAVSVILATYLRNKGFNVNMEFPWDIPHSGDYDLSELFDWIDNICK
jgi:hypothetical protein